MLKEAYESIRDCTCQHEEKEACYHCILTYGNQYSRDDFSREQAEILFGKLVGGINSWERIEGSVGTIAQSGAAEDSELELKFVRAMQTMAKGKGWIFEKVPDDDSYHYELHILDEKTETELRYSIKPQFELTVAYGVKHTTIPDFQIMCTFAKINGEEIDDLMNIVAAIEAQKKATSLATKKETRRYVPWAAAASVLLLVGLAWFFTSRNNGMQMYQSPAFAEQDTIDMTDSITSEMLPYNEE